MTPTQPAAIKIAQLFNRKLVTNWAEAEVREYKKLAKNHYFDTLDDLDLVIRYTLSERKKGDAGIQRRDLLRFVRFFPGELDRARNWNLRRGGSRAPVVQRKTNTNGEKQPTEQEWQEASKLVRQEYERFKTQMRNPSFQEIKSALQETHQPKGKI